MSEVTFLQLGIACDLSYNSLAEAMSRIGVRTYSLHVHPDQIVDTTRMLKAMGAELIENPLTPLINIIADGRLDKYGWYLECDGKRVGSRGV